MGDVAVRENALPASLSHIGAEPNIDPGAFLAVLTARNEELRLPDCLRHLWQLGVDCVILIDNQSTDRTVEIARKDSRVYVIAASGSYATANFGVDWVNCVLDRYALNHWVFVGDIDGLLVFPGAEKVGLRQLCGHLESIGSEAFRTLLLDCFPAGPLCSADFHSGDSLMKAAPWFEMPSLRTEPTAEFPYETEYGGIRERLFFPEVDPGRPARWLHQKAYNMAWKLRPLRQAAWFKRWSPTRSPAVTNVPLVRWREGARYISATHSLAPMRMAAAQPSGVLLHFKFLQDFHERAVDAVRRNAHWNNSLEYRRYLDAMSRDPEFSLHGPASIRYEGSAQLVRLGLMRDSPMWLAERTAFLATGCKDPS